MDTLASWNKKKTRRFRERKTYEYWRIMNDEWVYRRNKNLSNEEISTCNQISGSAKLTQNMEKKAMT